jgi:hypothetical protein
MATARKYNIVACRPVTKRRLFKQRPLLSNVRKIHTRNNRETVFSARSVSRCYKRDRWELQVGRQAEVILNHENPNVRAIGQGEPRHRKYKRLKLGGGQTYDRSSV